eukprot:TRINITY_DN42275_c0_g1_i1.p1 TRINITY_DN42275_c0_g1~~TRINITY_DN42275_c0_g1_i1.p1  ORF type:complete len:275 (+),score=74.95 TRINITY_DN42275_c0_g1_i1:77-901(+)
MPAKFDDIIKVAKEVLDDDYKTSGYLLKAKQKTSFNDAVLSTDVELWGKDAIVTPAKLTWKLPKPFGCTFIAIDKLEMDKTGGLKLEAISDKVYPGLKVKVTSDCKDPAKITAGATFTGIKDTQIIVDTKVANPQDATCEVTRTQAVAQCSATLGVKYAKGSPDFAASLTSGPLFGAVVAKGGFDAFTFAAHYKASPEVRCAANYSYGGKTNGNFSLGATYSGIKGVTAKAKIQQDMSVSCSLKYTAIKGFTPLLGVKYDQSKGAAFGMQLSIE